MKQTMSGRKGGVWGVVLKVIIAVATAIGGALGLTSL